MTSPTQQEPQSPEIRPIIEDERPTSTKSSIQQKLNKSTVHSTKLLEKVKVNKGSRFVPIFTSQKKKPRSPREIQNNSMSL